MNNKSQTRGRPKKKSDERLPEISRKLFSQHCAVFYACCMVYVLEAFLKTKHQKRIGHSQGGFTIYERLSQSYCFQNIERDCKQWGLDSIVNKPQLIDFIKVANGCAPKFVFKQILLLISEIIDFLELQNILSIQELELNQVKLLNRGQNEINKKYKYIRFSHLALKQLKMEKWNHQITSKIKQLWAPFVKIVSYSIFCIIKNINQNKYLKPFFSDAQHPEQTIIGQLNLQQIVDFQNRQHKNRKKHSVQSEKMQEKIMNPQFKRKFSNMTNQISKNRKNSLQNIGSSPKKSINDKSPQVKALLSRSSIILSRSNNIRSVTLITHPSLQTLEDKNLTDSMGNSEIFKSPPKESINRNSKSCESESKIQNKKWLDKQPSISNTVSQVKNDFSSSNLNFKMKRICSNVQKKQIESEQFQNCKKKIKQQC